MAVRRPPVRRCLFGRPASDDDFTQALRLKELDAARRFERRWNFDTSARDDDYYIDGEKYKWIKVKSASDSDIPEFYSRGYFHKCRRRACARKIMDPDEEDQDVGVQYRYPDSVSSLDLFLGRRVSDGSVQVEEPVTPPRIRSDPPSGSVTLAPSTAPANSRGVSLTDSHPSSGSPSSSVITNGSLIQSKLTSIWPVRKRARSHTPIEQLSKRERIDGL